MDEILKTGFEQLGLALPDGAVELFRGYYERLDESNRVMNLTAITGEEDTARLHFLDCAALLTAVDLRGKSVVDVGTGAGFPGVPLLIACPEITEITLLDSLGKRIDFLKSCCAELGLERANPVHARAEEFAAERRESYDAAVSRAVARLDVLAELALPLVKPGGFFAAMKGPRGREELAEASGAIEKLGGKPGRVVDYAVPGTDAVHSLIIIEKARPTPKQYPRRFAQIKKSPLR